MINKSCCTDYLGCNENQIRIILPKADYIMDKGLYCIGTSGIRCSRCYLFLPKEIMIDFEQAEQFLAKLDLLEKGGE